MRSHEGRFAYHDDDCLCAAVGCNRGGHAWSCCGACAEVSECTAPRLHPTSWRHPRHHDTTLPGLGDRPTYRTPEEVRALVPEAFAEREG